MKTSIIIPNYNGEVPLRENLPFVILSKEFSGNKIVEIIVIDDGSTDGSVDLIRKDFPQVRIIKHTAKRGISTTINTGVRSAKGELIVLFTPGSKPGKDFLVSALHHFENKRIFAVQLDDQESSCNRGVFKEGLIYSETVKIKNSTSSTFSVSSKNFIFRRDAWVKLGGVDEKLFKSTSWKILDVSYKALKRNYGLIWESESKIINSITYPSKTSQNEFEKDQLLFIWKNLTSAGLFSRHMSELLKRVFKKPSYLIKIFIGIWRLNTVLNSRKKEKKEAKVSDEAIFASFGNEKNYI